MLDIHIFDVDNGFCAAIDRHNHHTILIDTGFNLRTGFSPWQHVLKRQCRAIDCLILPAYHSEHLRGIPDLLDHCLEQGITINLLVANPAVDTEQFEPLKSASLWAQNPLAMSTKMHPECQHISQHMSIDDVDIDFFWNLAAESQDPQDMSLVTFISYEDIDIIFPSDLKTEGWQQLLQCEEFRSRLRRVNTFVAANHGHADGYCEAVFSYCRPDIIIVSNDHHERIDPRMLNQYKIHAKGAPDGVCDRKVFTTYDDGTITISKCLDRLRHVQGSTSTLSTAYR